MQNESQPQAPTPLNTETLPLTITPHHMFGYDVKIWLVIEILMVLGSGALFFIIDDLRPFWYLWLVLPLGVVMTQVFYYFYSHGQALTLTSEGVEVKTPQKTTFIPFEKLTPVRRGVLYTGGRSFMAMPISSPELDVSFVPSTLNWGVKDFKRFYAALPEQYHDNTDPKW